MLSHHHPTEPVSMLRSRRLFNVLAVGVAATLYFKCFQKTEPGFIQTAVRPQARHLVVPALLAEQNVVSSANQDKTRPLLVAMAATFGFAASTSLRGLSCSARKVRRQSRISQAASGNDVGVVLLSAGVGKRMGANIPKQYIKLLGLEIALHSLNTFLECGVAEIVIVCAEEWEHVFKDHLKKHGSTDCELKFTCGGKERQDSVKNGLAKITTPIVAIHDAARPLLTREEMDKVVSDAREYGAALLAVPTKATIKQAVAKDDPFVAGTPARKLLWEAHTPQVIRSDLLRRGFDKAEQEGSEVTDDVSLVELLGEKVKLTEGEYTNIKVTTPEDIAVAETILKQRGFVSPEWLRSIFFCLRQTDKRSSFSVAHGSKWFVVSSNRWNHKLIQMEETRVVVHFFWALSCVECWSLHMPTICIFCEMFIILPIYMRLCTLCRHHRFTFMLRAEAATEFWTEGRVALA